MLFLLGLNSLLKSFTMTEQTLKLCELVLIMPTSAVGLYQGFNLFIINRPKVNIVRYRI